VTETFSHERSVINKAKRAKFVMTNQIRVRKFKIFSQFAHLMTV
jgi:hypothetical protein